MQGGAKREGPTKIRVDGKRKKGKGGRFTGEESEEIVIQRSRFKGAMLVRKKKAKPPEKSSATVCELANMEKSLNAQGSESSAERRGAAPTPKKMVRCIETLETMQTKRRAERSAEKGYDTGKPRVKWPSEKSAGFKKKRIWYVLRKKKVARTKTQRDEKGAKSSLFVKKKGI